MAMPNEAVSVVTAAVAVATAATAATTSAMATAAAATAATVVALMEGGFKQLKSDSSFLCFKPSSLTSFKGLL